MARMDVQRRALYMRVHVRGNNSMSKKECKRASTNKCVHSALTKSDVNDRKTSTSIRNARQIGSTTSSSNTFGRAEFLICSKSRVIISQCREKNLIARAAIGPANETFLMQEDDSKKLQRKELRCIVLPCAAALCFCNLYRIFLPIALMKMAPLFGWQTASQGALMSAFLLGYATTQLAGGSLSDAFGGKIVLGIGMLVFVLATLVSPFMLNPAFPKTSLAIFLVSRFVVGLGEGVSMPAMQALVARNIVQSRRSGMLGIIMTGFHGGNMIGLLLSPLILLSPYGGWQALFVLYAAAAIPLIVTWWQFVPKFSNSFLDYSISEARLSKDVNSNVNNSKGSSSTKNSTAIPLIDMISSSPVWAVIVGTIVNHWGYFIYLTWLPAFLNTKVGFDIKTSSIFAILPWMAMAIGGQIAGKVADSLASNGVPLTAVRKAFQIAGFVGPAAALGAVLYMQKNGIQSPAFYVSAFVLALGLQSLGQAGFFTNAQDIAPRRAGSIVGVSNTAGSVAGLIGTGVTGWILQSTGGSWSLVFGLTIILYLFGTIFYTHFATTDLIFD